MGDVISNKLENQIAVVTGSDSGIGQATAVELAREGAAIAVNYLEDEAGAESTRRQIEELGAKAIVVRADVGKVEQVARLFAECEERLGTPNILVNNAGIDASGSKIEDLSVEQWMKAINTNVTGAFLCCKQLVTRLKKANKPGRIINITSVHQDIPRSGALDYDASKGALRNLTATLALELAPNKINVNSIAPGMVLTPMNQEAIDDPKKLEEQVQSIPWKRAAEPWEIARMALYLVSRDSEYVTGATFVVDGGLMLNQGQGA